MLFQLKTSPAEGAEAASALVAALQQTMPILPDIPPSMDQHIPSVHTHATQPGLIEAEECGPCCTGRNQHGQHRRDVEL